jgi:mitochondrial fission protein ELM1
MHPLFWYLNVGITTNFRVVDTPAPHRLPESQVRSDPRVWLVTGYRAGERAQIVALGEALGWPFEIKRLVYRKYEFAISLLRRRDLRGIVRERSSPLEPPWPDLVISAGMRNEPVCRWIRNQAPGRVRLVHIGRTWTPLENFDLVVTTLQYQLPKRNNVLHNTTTLHSVTAQRLAEEKAKWEGRLQGLPQPYIAVIVGGNSGPYTLGPKAATRLARQASALARDRGGSLLVTTSGRTSRAATEALKSNFTVPYELFEWTAEAADNPYHAYLALADAIIVTGDSISMLTEACATRKPVYIFDLGEGVLSMRLSGSHQFWAGMVSGGDVRFGALMYVLLMHLGPRFHSRDIRLVHRKLVETGRTVWLGDSFPPGTVFPPPEDVEHAVTRVRGLFPS